MSRIAIFGAGAIGTGLACLLAARGEDVALCTRGGPPSPQPMPLRAEGALEVGVEVPATSDAAAAVAGAELVISCVGAAGQKDVIDRVAPHLRVGQTFLQVSQYSLSALYLAGVLARRGLGGIGIAAMATTPLTGRLSGPGTVRVALLRGRFGVGVLAEGDGTPVAALMARYFGAPARPASVAEIAFSNPNPTAHAPNALANLTRIETGERWPNYGMMTPAVCAMIEGLDDERIRVAGAFGAKPPTLTQHIHESFGTPCGTLAEMCAHIYATRGGPAGPDRMDTRYIHEDVPFGLLPIVHLGDLAGVPTPGHRAFIHLLSVACGRDLGAENALLPALRTDFPDLAAMQAALAERVSPAAEPRTESML